MRTFKFGSSISDLVDVEIPVQRKDLAFVVYGTIHPDWNAFLLY